MKSTKLKIWKQDQKVKNVGISEILLPFQVQDGPKDKDVQIVDMPKVTSIKNDFLLDPEKEAEKFDAVHTYGVIRQVLGMYRRAFNRNGMINNVEWQWGKEPLKISPHAGEGANAGYVRGQKRLEFFYFNPEEGGDTVYTCRSFDIIAHELGHAILDSIKPEYWGSTIPQTGALHESFGDLTAIFTLLSRFDICERLIVQTKGDLHKINFLSAVAEEFGGATKNERWLRNADDNLKLSSVSSQVHELSKVFTGAVYDILVDIFEDHRDVERYELTESLHRVGHHITDLVLMAIYNCTKEAATFKDIAQGMLKLETNNTWKQIINKHFTDREIFGIASLASTEDFKLTPEDWNHSCHNFENNN